jgi:hypothetical protein
MSPTEYKVGMLVEHPKMPQWGPGKILDIRGQILTIYFRDVPEQKVGDAVKNISLDYVSLIAVECQTDFMLESLPAIRKGKGQMVRPRWSLDGAIAFSLRLFPMGFKDAKYIGDLERGERTYKIHASEVFNASLGNGRGERLLEQGNIHEVCSRALAAIRSPFNLLFRNEFMALRDGLKDPTAATRFFTAFFDVLAKEKPQQDTFEKLIDAVDALPFERGKSNPAKWPALTVFPFIARPDTFMFLKPVVTHRAAKALAFPLQYRSALNWRTHERLLALSDLLKGELLKRPEGSLHPEDWIDVQSFIWVTGRGPEYGGVAPYPGLHCPTFAIWTARWRMRLPSIRTTRVSRTRRLAFFRREP